MITPNSSPESTIDQAMRSARDAAAYQAATVLALKTYGPEILSFLTARMRSLADAEEAFSMFAEDMWKGLPGFAFRCSTRTWLYTLARNAANRFATAPHRRRERNLSLAVQASVDGLIQGARTSTRLHQRTDMKDKVRALRQRIGVEDQTLLMLHIDRGLRWRELAVVMHEDGQSLTGDALTAEAARLRKRFERVKQALRELAIAEGMVRGSGAGHRAADDE